MNEMNMLFYKNIPLTLYSRKGCERVNVGYVWEVIWRRRETATYWPQVLLTIAALFPHSAGLLNWGHRGPKHSVWSWFSLRRYSISNCDWSSNSNWLELYLELQLPQAVCGTWLYNRLTSSCFLWAYASTPNSTTSRGQGDILTSSTGCTCFLIDGSVEGQYVAVSELAYILSHDYGGRISKMFRPNGKFTGINWLKAKRTILKKINVTINVHFFLVKYLLNMSRILKKKMNVSFVVLFCLGKYSFNLDLFWIHLVF